jgi:hypothetical protein
MSEFVSFVKSGNRLIVLEAYDFETEPAEIQPADKDEIKTVCKELRKSTGMKVKRENWTARVNFLDPEEYQKATSVTLSRNVPVRGDQDDEDNPRKLY